MEKKNLTSENAFKYYYIDREWYHIMSGYTNGDKAWSFLDAEFVPMSNYASDEEFCNTVLENIKNMTEDDRAGEIAIYKLSKATEEHGELQTFHTIICCSESYAKCIDKKADVYITECEHENEEITLWARFCGTISGKRSDVERFLSNGDTSNVEISYSNEGWVCENEINPEEYQGFEFYS